MLYISHLKLKNFKSFRALNVGVPPSFICFAGPNGAGKSNILDAVRFVLGETSLKSLRARKVKDLIHMGAKAAEVMVEFDGDKRYDIRRAIREDGKVIYRLNGKRTTRGSILEALKRYNLDSSGRNIIAQGEVQRIVNMNGKERRGIIDAVAGVSDFEEKKKESLRDLDIVEARIKEANIVLGERKAFLEELEKEKETAIRYAEKRDLLNNSKGTLLKLEMERFGKEKNGFDKTEKKLKEEKEKAAAEYDKVQKGISETDSKRMELSRELQGKQKTSETIRRIEELKASIGSKTQLVKEREEAINKALEEQKELKKEISDEKKETGNLEKEIEKLNKELKSLEADAVKQKVDGVVDGLAPLKKKISDAEGKIQETRERVITLQSEINSKRELLASKKEDLKALVSESSKKSADRDFEKELNRLTRDKKSIDDEIEECFSRTKEINSEINELDKRFLELKEKASIYKVRSSPQMMNPALRFIEDLKKNGEGIYGTVADLIEFDPKYAEAIEAAGGARLLYVVVDSSYTAVDIIEKLKKARVGRATFVPLDVIRAAGPVSAAGFSSIIRKIRYSPEISKAMEYIFGDTLFIDGSGDARKVGIGNYRMVTRSGEIFERSGVISGGRTKSSILGANEIKKIEDELASTKNDKNSLVEELYSLREKESELRAKRSQTEIQIKTVEMEIKAREEEKEEIKQLEEKKKNLAGSIKEIESAIGNAEKDSEKLKTGLAGMNKKLESLESELEKEERELRKESDEANKRKLDLAANLSSLKATVEGKTKEVGIRKENVRSAEKRVRELEKNASSMKKEIEKAKATCRKDSEDLGLFEKKIAETGKKIEKLFENIKQLENELQELGKEREKKRIQIEKVASELNQLSVRKATVDTKLEDIREEYERYRDTEFLKDVSKTKLQENINECERVLAELGNVNMAAIEMYEKKKAEIEEVTQKLGQLSEERKAILKMIDEIEERKKEAFFEAFYAVGENFKKMFEYVNLGEGYLALDRPNEPFESGLHIKIRKGGHEYSIDALSGGEITLVALMFIFALQFYKPSPFYILDEVDAALDKPNSRNLADLIKNMSDKSQFLLVSHNDTVVSMADIVFGVTKTEKASKVVGLKLKEMTAA
jgi:chromosome segregation protein